MYPKLFGLAVAAIALASLACGISFDLPITEITAGPTITDQIEVPFPETPGGPVDLILEFGLGELNLAPGDREGLVHGIVTYNIADFKPQVRVSGSRVRLGMGELEIKGIPDFGDRYINEWDIKLGPAPLNLEINAGGYKGRFELGGLALHSLRLSEGASDVRLEFARPNMVEMESFKYQSGASSVEMVGLANANFTDMEFKSGAGNYSLDFSGELQRDCTVTIDTGFSNLTIIVPQGVSARVFYDGGLGNVDVGGGWQKSGDNYLLSGNGPTITIKVNLAAGNLELRTR